MDDGLATFMSGGLASFAYWFMAIPADNIKKSDIYRFRCHVVSDVSTQVE